VDGHQKAYVCVHVFDETRPVLLVSRAGGDWSFLCGDMHADESSSYRVVGIGHVLDHDPSIQSVLDLPPEWEAERATPSDDWIRTKCEPAEA
jgi:hypothetical protein